MANLGIQNNNAGNLKDPTTGNFQVFKNNEDGYKALTSDLEYKKSGHSPHIKPGGTIADLANVWAPASDNNKPMDWANNVAKTIGTTPDAKWADIPTDKLAKGIQVAEGTSTPQTLQKAPIGNLTMDGDTKISSGNKPQLTNEQMIGNINAMEKQGAKPEEIQGYLDSLKSGNSQSDKPPYPLKSQSDTEKENKDTTDNSLLAGTPQTLDKNPTAQGIEQGVLSTVGLGKVAQGAGYVLSNAMGTQDKNIEAQNQGAGIQGQLIQRIKEKKANGEDTSKLQNSLNQLTGDLGQSGQNIGNVGTGGISSKDIITSGLHGMATATLAGSGAIADALGNLKNARLLSSSLSNPIIQKSLQGALDDLNYTSSLSGGATKTISQLAPSQIESLLETAKTTVDTPAAQRLFAQAIKAISPLADAEMGNSVSTASKLASKGGGLLKSLLQNGGGAALMYGLGSGKVGNIAQQAYNQVTK